MNSQLLVIRLTEQHLLSTTLDTLYQLLQAEHHISYLMSYLLKRVLIRLVSLHKQSLKV